MKATEILNKFSDIMDKLKLSEDSNESEVVEMAPVQNDSEIELKEETVESENQVAEEQIELAEDMPAEDEMSPEDVIEDETEMEDKYATKEELAKALAEMKAMYEAIIDSMGSKEEQMEVPTELSADEAPVEAAPQEQAETVEAAPEVQEEQVEAPKQEASAEPITHSPEAQVEERPLSLYAQRGAKTTVDSVFNKLFK